MSRRTWRPLPRSPIIIIIIWPRREDRHALLVALYLTMKGAGDHFEDQPSTHYRGGAEAQMRLRSKRSHDYHGRDELIGSELLHEQGVEPSEGGFELWLQRS